MIDTNNKSLLLLISMNIVLFMVIFWLIGMIMGKDDSPVEQSVAVTAPPPVPVAPAPQAAPSAGPVAVIAPVPGPAAQTAVSLDESIEQAVNAPDEIVPEAGPEMIETVRTINVYYDGELVRMEETDNHGNVHMVISNSLKEIGKIAPKDEAYVEALRELEQGTRKHVSVTRVTHEVARQEVRAPDEVQVVDRFNKVDVSAGPGDSSQLPRLSLAEQIDSVVSDGKVQPRVDDAEYIQASTQDYVRTLDTEAVERANEMRTIKVKRGDSLWLIAVRAYGSGYEYPRIYKANPHLRNPDMIREGEILRVPL